MRSWLGSRDVQKILGVTQGRVSQLVREGLLIVEADSEGHYQYDRETVERLARNRAAMKARSAEEADERAALQAEARDRFKRQRELARAEAEARQKHFDALREREVQALEGIYECLRRLRLNSST